MKNEIIMSITVNGTKHCFDVKTKSVAKRITRLLTAMKLPAVSDIRTDEVSCSPVWEVDEVLKHVFSKAMSKD